MLQRKFCYITVTNRFAEELSDLVAKVPTNFDYRCYNVNRAGEFIWKSGPDTCVLMEIKIF